MNTEEFYRKILPSIGSYCVLGIVENSLNADRGRINVNFTDSIEELLDRANELDSDRSNYGVFIAPGTFDVSKSRRRVKENSVAMRCFFLDIDSGIDAPKEGGEEKNHAPKKYSTKSEALTALNTFLAESGLPPPVIVSSGNGYHCYWVFDQDIPAGPGSEWEKLAVRFKAFCASRLIIDLNVVADSARVLRVPLSHHKKDPNNHKLVTFLDDTLYEYSLDVFREFLDQVSPALDFDIADVEKGLDDDTASIARIDPNFESSFQHLALNSLNGTGGCAQIAMILSEAATLEEPLWRAGLSIAMACADAEEAIQLMSEDHPEYNREETIKKAQGTLGSNGPQPYTCQTLHELTYNGKCESCMWRKQIKSPIQLAKRLKAAPPEAIPIRDETDAEILDEPELAPRVTTYPDELQPFLRGPDGGVWYKPPAKKDKDGNWVPQKEVRIIPYNLYPIKRMYSSSDGEVLIMRYELKNDAPREFLLPSSTVVSAEKLRTVLGGEGVLVDDGYDAQAMAYIKRWGVYMQGIKAAEQTRKQMGWTEDFKGFVVGEKEYQGNGVVLKTAASPLVYSIAKGLKQSGNFSRWKEAASALNEPGYEMHAFGLLCGFGSPILHFTPAKGVVVGLLGSTGAAKTGALIAGLSLFGDPYATMIVGGKQGATDNGLIQIYVGMKNLMLGLDEASNMKSEDVSNLFYRVTQGRNKVRMFNSVNAIREIEATASLITLLTTNQSMNDKIQQFKADPGGELARYLELPVAKPESLTFERGKEIFDTFRNNYGWAGPEYIEYLFSVGDQYILEKIAKWEAKFQEAVGNSTTYRYFAHLVAVDMAGGEMACEANILDMDLERIFNVIVHNIIQAADATEGRADYSVLLGDFQNKYSGATLVLNGERVVREPRAIGVVARMVVDTGMYYVSATELRKFLAKAQVSVTGFKHYMKTAGLLQYEGKQRLTSGWPGMAASATPVSVLGFHSPVPPEILMSENAAGD